MLDRVIQQALAQVLGPLFEPGFSRFSYGFRPRRGAHDAVRQAQDYLKQGYTVAEDLDWARFFDSVNFDVLMRRVAAKVSDRQVLRLVWRYLRAGVVEDVDGLPAAEALGLHPGVDGVLRALGILQSRSGPR